MLLFAYNINVCTWFDGLILMFRNIKVGNICVCNAIHNCDIGVGMQCVADITYACVSPDDWECWYVSTVRTYKFNDA